VKTFLRHNAVFITLSLMLIAALGLALLYIPKGELHLLLCDHHTPARDIFYRYYTQIAEWFPYVVCIALLLFGRIGNGLFATTAMISSALTTQLFKHIVNAPRPVTWFAAQMPDVQLPLVEGVSMNKWFSFPSGHTTSFFALAFVVCILLTRKTSENSTISTPRNPKISGILGIIEQATLFFLAALGGYSRIYLSQHFPLDVFAGIVVGVLITMICYAIFHHCETQKWYNYHLFAKK
jgi:membrane-associated phospholipid phosphatase